MILLKERNLDNARRFIYTRKEFKRNRKGDKKIKRIDKNYDII